MNLLKRKGMLVVLSAPSGTGKTTIAESLVMQDPSLQLSISATTRKPRPMESDGVDYYFVSNEEFESGLESNRLTAHVKIFGHYYGTFRKNIEEVFVCGQDMVFVVDWVGLQQLQQDYEDDVISILILPPSIVELERRLLSRDSNVSEEFLYKRLSNATNEIAHWKRYDYVVVNEELHITIPEIQKIIAGERLRRNRKTSLEEFVTQLREEGLKYVQR
jgi:guanylate kinase